MNNEIFNNINLDNLEDYYMYDKEITIEEKITIEESKEDILEIEKTSIKPHIKNVNIIKIPINNDGIIIDDEYRVKLNGVMEGDIEYNCNSKNKKNSLKYNEEFHTSLTLPLGFDMNKKISITPYIERIHINKISNRELFIKLKILIDVLFF